MCANLSGSFGHDPLQDFLPGLQTPNPVGVDRRPRHDKKQHHEPIEPPCLPEKRLPRDHQCGVFFAPGPTQARLHPKRVDARREVGVGCQPPVADVVPIVVVALQHVAEAHILRTRKRQRRVADVKVALARGQRQRTCGALNPIPDGHRFDYDGRSFQALHL